VLWYTVAKAKRSAKRQVKAYEAFAWAQDERSAAGVVIDSPLDSVVRGFEIDRLEKIVDSLGPADREILRLRFRDGLRTEEVAERQRITTKAASKRISRALEKVKRSHPGGMSDP